MTLILALLLSFNLGADISRVPLVTWSIAVNSLSLTHRLARVDDLIDDGTYFVVEQDEKIAGCGGWSRRATLYGGNQTPGRDAALLNPATDAARVRAMYTHPNFTRRGVGRLILSLCEAAAGAEGFKAVELMATMSGEPLYRACGYEPVERVNDDRGGVDVPLLRMRKVI